MKKFRKYLRKLRRDFPAPLPVRVYLKPKNSIKIDGAKCYGFCHFKENGLIEIHVADTGNESVNVETLWHEWAHARIGFTKRHTMKFWTEYGRIVNFYKDCAV